VDCILSFCVFGRPKKPRFMPPSFGIAQHSLGICNSKLPLLWVAMLRVEGIHMDVDIYYI
jgi:hypothetical protein